MELSPRVECAIREYESVRNEIIQRTSSHHAFMAWAIVAIGGIAWLADKWEHGALISRLANATIEGCIKDEKGRPVPNTRVHVMIGCEEFETMSDKEGKYNIETRIGSAKVMVERCASSVTDVNLEPDGRKSVDLKLS